MESVMTSARSALQGADEMTQLSLNMVGIGHSRLDFSEQQFTVALPQAMDRHRHGPGHDAQFGGRLRVIAVFGLFASDNTNQAVMTPTATESRSRPPRSRFSAVPVARWPCTAMAATLTRLAAPRESSLIRKGALRAEGDESASHTAFRA